MRVVLDSSVLCSDYLLMSQPFEVFFGELPRIGYSLYVPEVVLAEARNNYLEMLGERKGKIDKLLSEAQNLARLPLASPLTAKYLETACANRDARVTTMLTQVGAVVLGYPSISHREIVERALLRKRPFFKSGDSNDCGYRDTLIWESVLDLACKGDSPVAFIVSDSRFYDGEQRLHPDLLHDLTGRGIKSTQIVPYRHPRSFLEEHVTPTLELLADVRLKMQSGRFPGFDIKAVVSNVTEQVYLWLLFEADLCDGLRSFPDLQRHSDYLSFYLPMCGGQALEVRRLTSGRWIAWLEVTSTFLFDQRFVGSVTEDNSVVARMAASAIFSPDSHTIESVEVVSVTIGDRTVTIPADARYFLKTRGITPLSAR